MKMSSAAPFSEEEELCDDLVMTGGAMALRKGADPPALPGQPALSFTDRSALLSFLREDLLTSDLDRMSPHLWLMATQSHAHISPLHRQIVRGRNILVTENPELHLVWINSRIFVKPLPKYLLSHAMWVGYFNPAQTEDLQRLRRASLGYLRTWHYLVRHESDFRIAKEHHLVPDNVSWPRFLKFIGHFEHVSNDEVSGRYRYGDLRLSRLNFWAKVFLGRWKFFKVHGQYAEYFAQFYAPVLFVFAIFSTVLNAMQVVLASGGVWISFMRTSKWFSVVTLLFVAATVAFFLTVWAFMMLRELSFALRHRLGFKSKQNVQTRVPVKSTQPW